MNESLLEYLHKNFNIINWIRTEPIYLNKYDDFLLIDYGLVDIFFEINKSSDDNRREYLFSLSCGQILPGFKNIQNLPNILAIPRNNVKIFKFNLQEINSLLLDFKYNRAVISIFENLIDSFNILLEPFFNANYKNFDENKLIDLNNEESIV